jgi:hypothetical protein
MAIQITGSFTNNFASYQNPQLHLVPLLTYRNGIAMNVQIVIPSELEMIQVGTIPMFPTPSDLVAPPTPINPYADLIYSLETYIIDKLTITNPECIFTRF